MNQTNFIELLSNFVEQRPGFDWANYDSMRSYRSDYLPTLKDKKTFFDLVEFGLRCFGFEQLNNKLGQTLS